MWDAVMQRWVQQYDPDATEREGAAEVLPRTRYNIVPASRLAIARVGKDGQQRIDKARWGFPLPKRLIFNTRIETAFESPLWRGSIGSRHCAVPVSGFYEWQKQPGGASQPYFVRRRDGAPMVLAGLWGVRQVEGRPTMSVSIVTCAPNAAMEPLHDRMPVVLEADGWPDWVRPGDAGHDRIVELAVPVGDVLEAVPVSRAVNEPDRDGPELIEAVAAARQDTLF